MENNGIINDFFEKYPTLFPSGETKDSFNYNFTIGKGWKDLVEILFDAIVFYEKHNVNNAKYTQVNIKQVKEKFGSLRFYYSGGDGYIRGLVDIAEMISSTICEVCGEKGEIVNSSGYYHAACKKHAKPSS